MTKRQHPPSRAAALAAFWRVHLRTAQRWLAEPGRGASPPAPAFDDPLAMLAWAASLPTASHAKLTPAFRARIDAFRIALDRGQPLELPPGAAPHGASAPPRPGGNPSAPDAHSSQILDSTYADFLASHALADATAPRDKTLLADLKLQAAYAVFQLQRAQTTGRLDRVKDALETIRHLSGVIHDEELRAQKLGREAGDILPRAEATRLLRALPYWLLRSTDDLLATLSRLLAAATAPLYPAAVRALLEPHLLAARVLTPLARAAQINAGTTLPDWALAAMRESLAATLEDGATLFDTLYATPVPSHPIQPSPSPILQVTTGPSSAGPSAVEAPSVSEIPHTSTASAISSDSAVGSGAAKPL